MSSVEDMLGKNDEHFGKVGIFFNSVILGKTYRNQFLLSFYSLVKQTVLPSVWDVVL